MTFPSTGSVKESDFSLLWKEKKRLSLGCERLIESVWLIWRSHRSQHSPLCVHPASAYGASDANMGVRGTSRSLSSRSSSSLKEIKEGRKIRDWEGSFSWGAEGRWPHWGWHLWGEKLRRWRRQWSWGGSVPERGHSSSRVLEARKHSARSKNTGGFWLELEKKCEMVRGEVRAVVRGQTVQDRKQGHWKHLESGGRRLRHRRCRCKWVLWNRHNTLWDIRRQEEKRSVEG